MPDFPTPDTWLHQSTLLMRARPTTTRITTKYTLVPPTSTRRPSSKPRKPRQSPTSTSSCTPALAVPPPTTTATLSLKTHDSATGTTLKYRTNKAFEVGRLVGMVARLGRIQAGLVEEETKEDAVMEDVKDAHGEGVVEPNEEVGEKVVEKEKVDGKGGDKVEGAKAGGGGGGKKKKKGKK